MKLNVLQIFAIGFILWEIIKLCISPLYWNHIKAKWFNKNLSNDTIYKKNVFFTLIEILYVIYVIILFFTQWWWIGLSLIGLSVVVALVMFPLIRKSEPFDAKILLVIVMDMFISVFLLWQVINPLNLI